MKTMPGLARAILLCCAILLGLLLAPAVVLGVFVGGMPNQFVFQLLEQWPLLKILWASNPEAAKQVLMQLPLLTIAHNDAVGGGAIWRLSVYPVSMAAQLFVAFFATLVMFAGTRGALLRNFLSLLPGMALLVVATTYVQVATCCTGGPRWALDLWLFSQASNAPEALINWQPLYAWTEGKVAMLQVALAVLGIALLLPAAMRARNVHGSPDSAGRSRGGQSGEGPK